MLLNLTAKKYSVNTLDSPVSTAITAPSILSLPYNGASHPPNPSPPLHVTKSTNPTPPFSFQPQADKLRTQQQLEQLQARYIGTGHADTTKHEWTSNIHRDSYASYIGHPPLLAYMAVGMGESRERVRAMCIEVSC